MKFYISLDRPLKIDYLRWSLLKIGDNVILLDNSLLGQIYDELENGSDIVKVLFSYNI
jgi:hypothetical protein